MRETFWAEVEFVVNVDVQATLDVSPTESLAALPAAKQAEVREAAEDIAEALVAAASAGLTLRL